MQQGLYLNNGKLQGDEFHESVLVIPEGVRMIDSFAFLHNDDITELVIPGTVKEIGKHAFAGCESLKTITLTEGIKKIEEFAFRGALITEIAIPGSVKEIGESAFYGCESLKTITLTEGIKKIGDSAFGGAPITEIAIPGSVKEIGESAFGYCHSLKKVILSEGIEQIGNCAFRYSVISELVIPSSVKRIGDAAFGGCKTLQTVVLPESVEEIGKDIFAGCSDLVLVMRPASEIASYFSALERTEQQRRKLRDQQNMQKKLSEQKSSLEQQLSAHVQTQPEEFAQIPDRRAQLESLRAESAKQTQEENTHAAALKQQLAQLETEVTALSVERKKCGLFALSKKKELDAAIHGKSEEQQALRESIQRHEAAAAAASAQRDKALQEAENALKELVAAKQQWNDKKLEMMASYMTIDEQQQEMQKTIDHSTDVLKTVESEQESIRSLWKQIREEKVAFLRKRELEEKKIALLFEIRNLFFAQGAAPAPSDNAAPSEPVTFDQARNEKIGTESSAATDAFAEAHKQELEKIRQINRTLGVDEYDGLRPLFC